MSDRVDTSDPAWRLANGWRFEGGVWYRPPRPPRPIRNPDGTVTYPPGEEGQPGKGDDSGPGLGSPIVTGPPPFADVLTGDATFSTRYEVRDALNRTVGDVTAYVEGGVVDVDYERDTHAVLSFFLRRALQLRPFADFIAPLVTIEPADGTPPQTWQLGLFRARRGAMALPHVEDLGFLSQGEHSFGDLSATMRRSRVGYTIPIQAGTNYLAGARTLLSRVALPDGMAHRFAWPTDPRTVAKTRDMRGDLDLLAAATDLTNAVGHYRPWPDATGTWRTMPYRPAAVSPDYTYRVGQTGQIIGDIEVDHGGGEPFNVLTVVQEDGDLDKRFVVTVAIASGQDNSPTGPAGELPRTEYVRDFADLAAVKAHALDLASRAENVAVVGSFPTRLEPWHGAHERYRLDLAAGQIAGDDAHLAAGDWRVTGYRHDLDNGRTLHRLARTETLALVYSGTTPRPPDQWLETQG